MQIGPVFLSGSHHDFRVPNARPRDYRSHQLVAFGESGEDDMPTGWVRSPRKWRLPSIAALALIFSCGPFIISALGLDLGPKVFPLKVVNISVDIPVSASLDVRTEGDTLITQIGAVGDLKSLQDKALEISRALPLPKDNCARDGISVVVDSIDQASITPRGAAAVVTLLGHVTAWACKRNIPLVGDAKTELASDSVTASVPVELVVVDQNQIGLKLAGPLSIITGNALTAEAARIFAGDFNDLLAAQLSSALDASSARASVPSLPGLEATINHAEFAGDGAKLTIRANGAAKMNSVAFNRLLQFLSP
jgi:hypothetical protein